MFTRIQRHSYTTFQKLGIPETTVERLKSNYGITTPTPAQVDFIPAILSGYKDMFIRDSTGTGKTFGIALALASQPHHSSLYLAPNQQLADQVNDWIQQLAPTHSHIIDTPSRLEPHALQAMRRIVLDEADQALRLPKRYATVRQTRQRQHHPKPAQLLLTELFRTRSKKPQLIVASATLNRPLRYWLTQQGWMNEPLFIDITKETHAPARIQHHCLLLSDDTIRNIGPEPASATTSFDDLDDRMLESVAILMDLEKETMKNSVLFVDNTVSIATIRARLDDMGIHAQELGEAQQQPTLWIATEFSARGMDLPDISHVFILGQPPSVASYLHMAGRAGRLGHHSNGKVITLLRAHGRAESKMANLFKLINVSVEPLEHVE